jgi:uncharacterized protein
MVLQEVERIRRAGQKSIIIVTGGPGNGKSVIALSLFGELPEPVVAPFFGTFPSV